MKKHGRVALVAVPAIYEIALRSLIGDHTDRACYPVERTDRLDARTDDFIITTVEEFLGHIDFYMPRKRSVALMDENFSKADNYPVITISRFDTESEIIDKIRGFLNRRDNDIQETESLSQRETDVLRELVSGKTNKEIADTLCISVNTVITHRKNISGKLGIRSVSGLSLYAMMNGLV